MDLILHRTNSWGKKSIFLRFDRHTQKHTQVHRSFIIPNVLALDYQFLSLRWNEDQKTSKKGVEESGKQNTDKQPTDQLNSHIINTDNQHSKNVPVIQARGTDDSKNSTSTLVFALNPSLQSWFEQTTEKLS